MLVGLFWLHGLVLDWLGGFCRACHGVGFAVGFSVQVRGLLAGEAGCMQGARVAENHTIGINQVATRLAIWPQDYILDISHNIRFMCHLFLYIFFTSNIKTHYVF